ncbi:hypothetical protein [Butyrivibrio sp. INlla16]|uniref:hypothetical protein n=1 Tax=Butyrivibrio sp. INlla16 TaxID=1520807 RepID=UPI001FA6EE0C|nr:hypothetical protein [Butyrivibrio sp. INlla16]
MNYYRHIDRSEIQFDFLTHRPEKDDYDDEILIITLKPHGMRTSAYLTNHTHARRAFFIYEKIL